MLAGGWQGLGIAMKRIVGPRAKVYLEKNERVRDVNGRKHFIFGKAFCQDPGWILKVKE